MDAITLLGASGAAILLIAFLMNQTHKWSDEYLIYDVSNLLGASLLVLYSYLLGSYPFLVLNVVWGFMSLRDVVIDWKRNRKRKARGFYKKWMQ